MISWIKLFCEALAFLYKIVSAIETKCEKFLSNV